MRIRSRWTAAMVSAILCLNLAACSDSSDTESENTADAEEAALGIDGTSYSEDSSFESAYLGQAIGEDEEFTYTTWWGSYIDQLPEDYTLSAWIQAGTSDTSVPYTQSENFAAALAEVIGEDNVNFSLIEGAEHEDDAFYTDENLAEIFAFLDEAL